MSPSRPHPWGFHNSLTSGIPTGCALHWKQLKLIKIQKLVFSVIKDSREVRLASSAIPICASQPSLYHSRQGKTSEILYHVTATLTPLVFASKPSPTPFWKTVQRDNYSGKTTQQEVKRKPGCWSTVPNPSTESACLERFTKAKTEQLCPSGFSPNVSSLSFIKIWKATRQRQIVSSHWSGARQARAGPRLKLGARKPI